MHHEPPPHLFNGGSLEQTPPPIIQQQPATYPGESRSPLGWIIVGFLAVLLVTLSTVQYFSPGPGEGSSVDTASIRQSFLIGEVQNRLRQLSPASAAPVVPGRPELDSTRTRLEQRAVKSEEVALAAVAIAVEQKKAPNPKALANISDSKDPGLSAYAKAVSAPQVTAESAKDLTQKLKGDGFIQDLARRQIQAKAGAKDAYKGLIPSEDVDRFIVLILGITGALMLGGGAFLLGLILVLVGKWQPVGLPSPSLSLAGADRYALRMGFYLLIYILAGTIVAAILSALGSAIPSGFRMLIPLFTVTALVIAMLHFKVLGRVDGLKGILGKTDNLPRLIMVGVLGFLGNIPILLVLAAAVTFLTSPIQHLLPTPSHPANDLLANGGFATIIAVYITAGILAPIVEEITFRGLLSPALARVWNITGAILVQGFFFAAIHPQGPIAWPMLMAVGCVAAFISHREGSLIPAIVMHAIHNTAVLTIGLSIL
jgi:membrane protease YdiL (CAAX protease family)